MSTIKDLKRFPRELTRPAIEPYLWMIWTADAPTGWHESLFRSFQILEKAKDLLRKGTPQDVILEIIAEAEN